MNTYHRLSLIRRAGCMVVAVAACAMSARAQGTAVLAVDGRSNENVNLAAKGQFVAAVWSASMASGTDIFASVSKDGGATFSAPARVNAKMGEARVGGEQPPRVALVAGKGATPAIVVVWTTKGTTGSRLLTARSTDGGQTFSASKVVPGGEAAGNRGWESIAVDAKGHVLAMWLDHRNLAATGAMAAMNHHQDTAAKAAQPAAPPAPKPDPVARAEQSQLFFASLDGSVKPRAITGGVCYCCKTSLVTTANNAVYGVWRHVFTGNQRDIGFAVSRDGGKTFAAPVRVSEDHWEFDGCPENGPAVAVDREHRAHVVWPTPVDGKSTSPLGLFYAVSSPDGRTFSPRVRVPSDGPAYHVQIVPSPDGSTIVAWDELAGNVRKVKLARAQVDAAGRPSFTALPAVDAGSGVYPSLAATSTGTVVAWVRRAESGTVIAVARITR